jgi:23S rRNA (uracil1939-C5)-methyltransferase
VNRTGSAGAGGAWASLKAGSPAQSVREKEQRRAGTVAPCLPKLDLIVVDPPRSGLGDHVARALASTVVPRLTYVSCDPATLARDLVQLQASGYRVEEAHLVDLFPQTYHLESILQLVR